MTVLVTGTAMGLGIFGCAWAHTAAQALAWISLSIGGLSAAAPVGWSAPSLIAPRGSVGRVGGILNFSNQISGIAAPIVTGYLVEARHAFSMAFAVAAAYLVVGIGAYLVTAAGCGADGELARSSPQRTQSSTEVVWSAGLRLRLCGQGAHGAGGDAAVDEQGLAGDVAAGFRGEEDDGAVEVVGGAGAAERDAFDERADPGLVFVEDLVLRGFEPSGGEAVDGDAVRAPVVGEAHGELADAAAAGAVGREAGVAKDAGDGADVDDAAVAALDHTAGDGLGDEEAAAQVGVEDEVPVVPGDVESGLADVAAGIVDEDVNRAEGGFGFFGEALDAGGVADVEFQRDGAAAEGVDLGFEVGECFAAAAGEDEVGSGAGEGAGEVLAEAAAGSGDEGDLAGEVEEMSSLIGRPPVRA